MHAWVKPPAFAPVLAMLLLNNAMPGAPKTKIARFSYGDEIDTTLHKEGRLSSKDAIERSFQYLRDHGFTTIYWRMYWEGHPADSILSFNLTQMSQFALAAKEFEGTPYAWKPHEIAWPVEVAHRLGLKFYAWIVPFNGEGTPPGFYHEYAARSFGKFLGEQPERRFRYWRAVKDPTNSFLVYETEFPYQSKFVHDHPEYQAVDRSGKRYHYGILEWAYPEARNYWLNDIKAIVDNYAVDGLYIDTRVELMGPEYADQYGFNEPVVKEFQKRYQVNILEEDFDIEKWRALRGEYFTLFLREISELVHARRKLLSLGTARGEYIGYPIGNMKLEWRKWISEKIVDEFHVDEYGWGWGPQGYGYVTDYATGRGLKPLDVAVREDYGPLCRSHGVKLYFACSPYRPRPISDECCAGRPTPNGIRVPADWCERMASLPEFDGEIARRP